MEELPRRLAATISTLLSLRQMKKKTLAQRARMSKSQVSDYLSGSKTPQLRQLVRIADALEVDLLTLFFTASRIEEVQRRMAALSEPGELRDEAGNVLLLREGGLLIRHPKHPLSDVTEALNRLNEYIENLQLALATQRKGPTQP